ncbi:MAG: S41 family peptidase [Planctomycetota bacterium]
MRTARSRLILTALTACLAPISLVGCATQSESAAETEPVTTALNLESFDYVWTTVDERHYDPDAIGEQWDAARAEYRPKVEAAETNAQARVLINEMLLTLGLSHFGIIGAEAYQEIDAGGDPAESRGATGIEVRLIDGQAVVFRVAEGSTGADAGIEPGWVLLEIDGRDVAELIETLSEIEAGPTRPETVIALRLEGLLRGSVGDEIELVALDRADARTELTLTVGEPLGEIVGMGSLPPSELVVETETLDGGIVYLKFNYFLDPVKIITTMRQVAADAQGSPGVIIDLRGNRGGLVNLNNGIAGFLTDKRDQKIGEMITRENQLQLQVNPRPGAFTGPVAVLIDEVSISSAEILSGGLQDLNISHTFGSRTAGLVLPSTIERLPNGDGFQYVLTGFRAPSGRVLEEAGVYPDTPAPLTREDLIAGRDRALYEAASWLAMLNGVRPTDPGTVTRN